MHVVVLWWLIGFEYLMEHIMTKNNCWFKPRKTSKSKRGLASKITSRRPVQHLVSTGQRVPVGSRPVGDIVSTGLRAYIFGSKEEVYENSKWRPIVEIVSTGRQIRLILI